MCPVHVRTDLSIRLCRIESVEVPMVLGIGRVWDSTRPVRSSTCERTFSTWRRCRAVFPPSDEHDDEHDDEHGESCAGTCFGL
jgi:hypothetical protein